MAITPEGLALGHKYESSRMSGAVWCYNHKVPQDICDFDDEED